VGQLTLFFATARLELDEVFIERVLVRMRRVGAAMDPLAPVPVQESREG
jgi:hypothetical protein